MEERHAEVGAWHPMVLGALFAISLLPYQISLPPAPGPLNNPMKGFASYSDPGETLYTPAQMAYEGASWAQIEPTEGHYAFDKWEAELWNSPNAKGKHIVLRFFMDYPNRPVAVPQWLIAKGVKMTPYDEFGGGSSPDYSDPRLREALKKLIAEMGKRYDRNPRIDFIEVGLLGHWGEWHTYPRENLFASPEVQKEVIDEMHAAFPHKQLQARNPSYASCQLPWLGFHDDLIPSDTLGKDAWDFVPEILSHGVENNWKVAPMGGEMVPGEGKKYVGVEWSLLTQAVKAAHFTWIGPYSPAMVSNLDASEKAHVDELIRMLGYQFQLEKASFSQNLPAGASLDFQMTGTNQGVAPFYQPWIVRMALLDQSGKVRQAWDLKDDVRKWLPGPFSVAAKGSLKVPAGHYKLAVGIVDPANDQPAIHFANQLDEIGGYTVLGTLDVVKPLTN